MTVLDTRTYTDWMSADGERNIWPYDITILQSEDVYVQVREADGSITDHTENFLFKRLTEDSGTVRFPADGDPLESPLEVRIRRVVPYTQSVRIGNEGRFLPKIHENAFDRLVMQIQQLEESTLKLPFNTPVFPPISVIPGRLIGFAGNGLSIVSSETTIDEKTLREQADLALAGLISLGGEATGGPYQSQTAVTFTEVGTGIQSVWTMGRAEPGDRGEGLLIRMRLDVAQGLGIAPEAMVRSQDRFLPDLGGSDGTQGGWWVKAGPEIKPEQFGPLYTDALLAIDHAIIMDLPCNFGYGQSYSVDEGVVLHIPDNAWLKGDALFTLTDPAPEGTGNGSTSISGGDNIRAERLRFQVPGGAAEEISARIFTGGNNPDIGYMEVIAATQRIRGGIEWSGLQGHLGRTLTRKVDRPLLANNPDPELRYDSYWRFGDFDFESIIRGFRPEDMRYVVYGDVDMRVSSPNAEKLPGANGVLSTACPVAIYLRPLRIDGIKEHSYRAGGSTIVDDDSDGIEFEHSFIHIAGLFITNCDGCALKLNQNGQLTEYTYVGFVDGLNVGQDTAGHGEEMVRIAKAGNGYIGPIISRRSDETKIWPRAAVQINNTRDFSFGPILGTYRQQLIDFNGDGDIGQTFGAGPITGCRFVIGNAHTEGQTGFRFYGTRLPAPGDDPVAGEPTTVGDIDIVLEGAGGWTENMFVFHGPGWDDEEPPVSPDPGVTYTPIELTGLVRIFGEIAGPIGPKNDVDLEINPTADKILINLGWQGKRVQGVAAHMRSGDGYLYQWQGAEDNAFDPGDFPPTGLFIGSKAITGGIGEEGIPIEFSRIGDNRRGAAIVPWQSGAESQQMGMRFYVGAGGGPSEQLKLVLSLDHSGNAVFDGSVITGEVMNLNVTADIAGLTIPGSVGYIQTSGRADSGDGGHSRLIRSAVAEPGGATDAGGGHWRIADNPVRPAQFGNNSNPGVTNMTSALRLMSEYATKYWLNVDFHGTETMLIDADALIEFDHPMDWSGLDFILDGGIVGSPDADTVQYAWHCVSEDTPLLTGTYDITGDAAETKLANSVTLVESLTLSIGTADGYTYVAGGAGQLPVIAGRHPEDATLTYRQSFATIRGKALEPLSRDVAFTSLSYRSRANTDRGWLEMKGLRYDTALGNNQGIVLVERNQTILRDIVFDTSDPEGTEVDESINRLVRYQDCGSIIHSNIEAPAQKNPSSGSYVISMDNAANILTVGVKALDGWGAFGCDTINGWYASNLVVNRVDCHGGMHNCYVDESVLHDIGIKYGWGGGVLKVANSKAINCPLISSRNDYGGYFYGSLHADDCTLVSDAFQVTAIDLETSPIGPDTIIAPCPDIHITNLRREGRDGATGSTSEFRPVAIAVRKDLVTPGGAAMGVEAPAVVQVDGVFGSGGWRFAMPIDYANMINSTQVSGNNHFCHVERVYPQSNPTVETQGIYVPPQVLATTPPSTVSFFLRDIRSCIFDALALDTAAVLNSVDVQWMRLVMANNTRAELWGGILMAPLLVGADTTTILGGSRTTGTSFTQLTGVIVRGAWDLSRVRAFSGVDIQDTSANNLVVLPTGCTRPAAKRGWQSKGLYAIQAQHIPDVTLAELATMPAATWDQHFVWVSDAAGGAGQLAFSNGAAWGVIALGAAPA